MLKIENKFWEQYAHIECEGCGQKPSQCQCKKENRNIIICILSIVIIGLGLIIFL